ncbi:hypothetical protein KUTeg_023553 [Tegillarca granosa]|uniref:Glycogen [starch] synthase n=1 Tax=Tegillarca granosa TaxID=220873 RepID=A0ABQ9E228_TEGGR|nr:hypothetical protein KUTeg_023553 [Tegillarca granosa]
MLYLQYYRKARQIALVRTYPDAFTEDNFKGKKFMYPKPASEPSSPSASRSSTPAPSDTEDILNNDDEEDDDHLDDADDEDPEADQRK